VAYNPIDQWPQDSLRHELLSIAKFLDQYVFAPNEIRTKEIEGSFMRPMIQLTLVNSTVNNRSQYDFSVVRNIVCTYFGSLSEDKPIDERANEASRVHDWLTEVFARGNHRGPIIPIYNFAADPPASTEDWIEIETAVVELRPDKFNLWTVPAEIRYAVSRDEAESEQVTGTTISSVERRIIIT